VSVVCAHGRRTLPSFYGQQAQYDKATPPLPAAPARGRKSMPMVVNMFIELRLFLS
jgi:hypothetical protein